MPWLEKRRFHIGLLVLGCLLLSGCQTWLYNRSDVPQLKLLPPIEGPHPRVLKQIVTLKARKQQHEFLVVTRLEKAHVAFVVLLPTGQRMLTLEYDGEQLLQQQLGSIELPGEDILAILQFALWSENSIKQHYPKDQGWQVEVGANARRLSHQENRALEVLYQKQGLAVENYARGYQVQIHTLETLTL